MIIACKMPVTMVMNRSNTPNLALNPTTLEPCTCRASEVIVIMQPGRHHSPSLSSLSNTCILGRKSQNENGCGPPPDFFATKLSRLLLQLLLLLLPLQRALACYSGNEC